ncbi:hypothetical protein [Sphingomonas sp. CFBP9019]|uniref:hypothetical protein n=1 Tax=Sphingomonas sp. CFBP9019 TaxID=3096532 RepID=UPI002A69F17B|nr:hypothetical protein [Sphingomonas sp. CFBP9019]MDY1006990.1 hypothetical protein [Sphingomonas sp. CFBP9019]
MTDYWSIVAMTVLITIASRVLLWGIDLCCRHEVAMLEQRARNGEANGLRGGDQGLGVHTQLGTQTQERNHVR